MDEQQTNPVALIQLAASGENLVPMLEEAKADEIARKVAENYRIDLDSMQEWRDRMQKAIDLAMLVKDTKSYPFEGASNIKFPLVTQAALQFNARAYPALCPASDVVKAKVWGEDRNGEKAARGLRTSTYMSRQLIVEIDEWERETDKLTLQVAIVGDMFRKWWFDPNEGRVRCRLIAPGKYVVNANAQTLDLAPRGTEELSYYPYEITENEASGWFVEIDYTATSEDDEDPEEFIEQQCRIDLDEDGYPEPYIATVHLESDKLVRLVGDFTEDDVKYRMGEVSVPMEVPRVERDEFGQAIQVMQVVETTQQAPVGIIAIKRRSFVVHHQLMPGMDGTFFGTGLGMLLGDISAAVNSTFNMLMDAGHYASLGGGFIGSEFRLKGGAQRMRPGEWRTVSAAGGDVRSGMVPMTYPGADPTLFAMLGMLQEAAQDVSSTKDILTGETGGRNMQPTTVMALIEQGMKVFTAVYKRLFRSVAKEYRILAGLNAAYVSQEQYNAFLDDTNEQGIQVMHDPRVDFALADMDIQPVADPEAVTRMQEMAKAQLVMEAAEKGMADPAEAMTRVFEAASIDDADALLPKPDPMAEQMKMMTAKAAEADVAMKLAELQMTMAKTRQANADAFATVAGVEQDAAAQKFDEVMRILEMKRDDLARMLGEGGSGMAGASGDGNAPRRPVVVVDRAQGGPVGSIPFGA